jgi:outer membrane protein assembly factor BamB
VPASKPDLTGTVVTGDGVPSDLPGAWPRFRGPRLDNISTEPVRLARSWAAAGPPQLWALDVGEGHAGAAVDRGRVYVLDYDREAQADALRCLSLDDGSEIWRYSYPVKIKRNHGMSRTVPTVAGDYVVGLGPKCHVTCLDAETGELKWVIDLVWDHGTRVPPWYAGQCPLVDGDRVVLAPGGPEALLMAVDLASGEIVWKTPNPRRWNMTHASIVPTMVGDTPAYLYAGSGGVAAVAPEDGRLLWDTTDWKINIATVASPVPLGDDRIFLSGGYDAGAMMIELDESAEGLTHRDLFRLDPDVFGAAQQTPIFYRGHIYGVRPDGQLVCLSASTASAPS